MRNTENGKKMTPKQAIEIYKKQDFYRGNVVGMTESDKYYHLYDDESCGNLCVPVSIVEKENGKCILFSSVTDGDFGLRFGQMRIVPESQYK